MRIQGCRTFLVVLLLLFSSKFACAIDIRVSPAYQEVRVGEFAQIIDIYIEGLGSKSAPSLSAYDIEVHFNPLLFDVVWMDFDANCQIGGCDGSWPNSYSLRSVTDGGATWRFFGSSVDSASYLDSTQPASFSLVSFGFLTRQVGVGGIDVVVNALGDSVGSSLAARTSGGLIAVIPEPASSTLLSIGCFGLLAYRRWTQQRRPAARKEAG